MLPRFYYFVSFKSLFWRVLISLLFCGPSLDFIKVPLRGYLNITFLTDAKLTYCGLVIYSQVRKSSGDNGLSPGLSPLQAHPHSLKF